MKLAATPAEAKEHARNILGLEIQGLPVRKVLVTPAVDIDHNIVIQVEEVETKVQKLSAIESETDALGIELTRLLYENEEGMSPGTFTLWYELIHRLGDIADYAEDVGDRLRLLVAR